MRRRRLTRAAEPGRIITALRAILLDGLRGGGSASEGSGFSETPGTQRCRRFGRVLL
ncbi:hypothetical protein AVDCRST_MAG82-1974 [uncultured Rubrobacteraceae bacterium]|uniref:Uncharacterized protein n=1 Tax=uncultured Rubrobacteraceae bacterium TaxID=349277 RepID=A0A6J4PYA0_9ACTN|nr:hypothetical protein AVDCRST_MAG82-1974 [uncultured Rubrobacteraceae bacterium]